MFCPNCGAHNEDDAVFCGECGVVLRLDELAPESTGGDTVMTAEEPLAGAESRLDDLLPTAEFVEEQHLDPEPQEPEDLPEVVADPVRSAHGSAPTRSSSAPTSGLALASFLLGIGGLTILPLIGSVLAVLFGYMARNDIRARPTQVSGDGLATAGIVMGWVPIAATVLIAVLALLGVVAGICGFGLCGVAGSAAG